MRVEELRYFWRQIIFGHDFRAFVKLLKTQQAKRLFHERRLHRCNTARAQVAQIFERDLAFALINANLTFINV